jgi:cell wall assembly regulator SMI1
MSTQIKRKFESITEKEILSLEKQLKSRLPEDYRDFLLAYNGGNPRPNVFFISPEQQESSLSILFGITSKKAYDLWTNALDAYEDKDRTVLPIGEDPGGNQIYMSLHPNTYGHIFFCDHEMEAPDCMFPIAESFTDLLQKLYEAT